MGLEKTKLPPRRRSSPNARETSGEPTQPGPDRRAGQEVGAAQRARRPAEVDPAVDAGPVEGVRAVAQPPHLVRRLQRLQAHDARRRVLAAAFVVAALLARRVGAGGRRQRRLLLLGQELGVLHGGEPALHLLGLVVCGVRRAAPARGGVDVREAAESHDGEHQQDGVPDGAEHPAEDDDRLRDREAVAHQREPHDRSAE